MATGFPLTAWFYWIGGGVLALFGFGLLYWSLLLDLARGRRRCPRCWYDMSGTPGSLTCSECGKVVKRERHLRRTRRHWIVAALGAIVILLGYVSYLYPRADRDGWVNAVPTTALILLNPHVHLQATRTTTPGLWGGTATTTTTDQISQALIDRLEAAALRDPRWCEMHSWQWWLLLSQARSRERNSSILSSPLPKDLKQDFYNRVVAHALWRGLENPDWPFKEYAERARTCVTITGGAVPSLGQDRIQWAIRRQSVEFCRRIAVNATPSEPPDDSVGIWLPREIALAGNDLAYWTVDSTGPIDDQEVSFDVLLGFGEGFATSLPQKPPVFRVKATYRSNQMQTAQSAVNQP